ncbi:MarR family winged helix-turn-helix transcriptional regulator [Actinocorallia sp. A-T 12471]|uniref:MarR family winged helix-turn-helix transcriptional regulator n=1 Tax=Actinocorallia sp. A-T 12471 TaxID=3089813 RepID=UPI0029CC39D6|nr:MarR family transcriptional regulator [Actinocorallia sp. A-T 12471]MDX6744173.1 MarR family transcriptional regulator [Actinocorallia sp. A-T 12471]
MLPTPEGVRAQWAAGRPDLDTSPMEVVGLLKQINALLAQAFEPLYETAPVTPSEVDILITLRYAERPAIACRLAEHHGLSRAGMSKTLAKLEKRGYITRTPNPADRRAALVTITPTGATTIDSFFPGQLAVEAALLSPLGNDRDGVVAALTLLSQTLQTALTRRA